MPKRLFGWIRDVPDPRDKWFRDVVGFKTFRLPDKVDLRDKFGPIEDQGELGSCTSQAASAALEYLDVVNNRPMVDYSRLFIYYNARWIKSADTGAQIRDVYKTLATYGACHETTWPYDIEQYAKKPSDAAYSEGLLHQALEYARVSQGPEIRQVLAEGFPVEFGFTVFENFYRIGPDGIYTQELIDDIPNSSAMGGHAVEIVGFLGDKELYIIRNSWGSSWGDKGYFYMPYSFVEDPKYCSDFWVVRKIENGEPDTSPTPRPWSICPCFKTLTRWSIGDKKW